VGSITLSGGAALVSTNLHYFVATTGTFDQTRQLPYAATKADNGSNTIKNLPPGQYNVYRVCDLTRVITPGGTTNAGDGFPETISASKSATVQAGEDTPVDASSGMSCN